MYPPKWLDLSSICFWFNFILFSSFTSLVYCIHVQGIWSPSTILKVITRFGFQKTDQNYRLETSGYIYGNVTLLKQQKKLSTINSSTNHINDDPFFNAGVLLFANRTLFKHIYGNYLKIKNLNPNCNITQDDLEEDFCIQLFKSIHHGNFDKTCNNSLQKNYFLRYIPCPDGGTCDNPYQEINLPNYQLTYVVDGQKDASFWYLLLLPCTKKIDNHSCVWTRKSNLKILLSYDLWIVNGHPTSISNRMIDFDHQFSYEQQNFWVYICLNIGYIILLIIQTYALFRQKLKNLNYLFTISLLLHSLSYFFICLHKIVFAHNGKGFETLFTIAEIMKIMSTALLMLFVLIIAKGWPFTKQEIFSKTVLIFLATTYSIIKILLFIWIKDSLNIIEEVDEYHTVPGWISLGFRIILMLWFIYELRHTMMLEQDSRKLKFYLHFGAGMLVWFVHLPLVAMVAMHIDLMWRYKIITGFSSMADFAVYAILTRIMWNTNDKQLLIDSDLDFNEELEYYDDNNSFIHSETYKFSNYRSKHLYDNHVACDKTTIKT